MNKNSIMSFTDVGSGFPVLLGHSYLFDSTMWSPQIALLSEGFRVIVPDLWGHGHSPTLPSSVMSLTDLAYDFLALMDHLGIHEFAVVGLSVGGMWGAELAALAPDRVKSLMLFDTYLGEETTEAKDNYFSMLNAVAAAGVIPPSLVKYMISQFYSEFSSGKDRTELETHLSSLTAENLRESIVPLGKLIFGRPDRMSVLDRITCPVFVATGELDQPRPVSEGQAMADRLKCDFSVIPHAGHISNREQPQFVTDLINSFLKVSVKR